MFFWIPALIPLLGDFLILVSPFWPISANQGAADFERAGNWQKFGIHFGINLLVCLLIALAMWFGATAGTKFPEVWHFKVTDIQHEMEWTTRETRTETYTTGSGKNQTTHTRTVAYTQPHGPFWNAKVNGHWCSINESTYNKWRDFWGNQRQTGIHKGSSAGFTSIDGPIYQCEWPKTFETIYPWAEIHRYVNKVRLSQSVLRFKEPTEELLAKYPRPADGKNTSPIISYGGPSFNDAEKLMLRRVNAEMGFRHQIHTMLVTFPKDASMSIFDDVMSAWGGPNKNELCAFICLDGKTVKWVKVYSWMDNTEIHATLRDELAGEPFTVERYAGLLRTHIPRLWRRKHFTPMNEYLQVPINPWWMISGIIAGIVSVLVSFIVIEFGMNERGSIGGYRNRRLRRYR